MTCVFYDPVQRPRAFEASKKSFSIYRASETEADTETPCLKQAVAPEKSMSMQSYVYSVSGSIVSALIKCSEVSCWRVLVLDYALAHKYQI